MTKLKKEDIKGLGIAYLGCWILTIVQIYYFETKKDSICDITLLGCICIFWGLMIKDYLSWGNAIGNCSNYIVNKLSRKDLNTNYHLLSL